MYSGGGKSLLFGLNTYPYLPVVLWIKELARDFSEINKEGIQAIVPEHRIHAIPIKKAENPKFVLYKVAPISTAWVMAFLLFIV